MTLSLSPEEKALREKAYKKEYSRQYYREQKAENNERYKIILEKAKERYHKKTAEIKGDNGGVRKYKKRNILEAPFKEKDEIIIEEKK
jgi:hypothetical protein